MATSCLGRSLRRISGSCAVLLLLCAVTQAAEEPPHSAELDAAIVREAKKHGVPERLVRRVVMRESRYNPRARNHSFWGLMQISYPTARSMGFKGTPQELLNPAVNLAYAVPYLANAFIVAGKREDAAIRLYASGYYATAKQRGLVGALRTADSTPLVSVPAPIVEAAAAPAQGLLGLFGVAPAAPAQPQSSQADGSGGAQLAYAEQAAPQSAEAALTRVTTRSAAGDPQSAVSTETSSRTARELEGTEGSRSSKHRSRDGGVTVMARGEQAAEATAFLRHGASGDPEANTGRHRTKKNLEYAKLEPIGSVPSPEQPSERLLSTPPSAPTPDTTAYVPSTSNQPSSTTAESAPTTGSAPRARARPKLAHHKRRAGITTVAATQTDTASSPR